MLRQVAGSGPMGSGEVAQRAHSRSMARTCDVEGPESAEIGPLGDFSGGVMGLVPTATLDAVEARFTRYPPGS
jgi:hypothetical protein